MQIEEFLEQSARRSPNKTALVCDNKRYTYAEIDAQCNRLAHGLLELGVQRGDRVGIFLDNTAETVISIFAVLKAGGVFMVINPTTKADKLAFILNNSRAKALITHSHKAEACEAALNETPQLTAVVVVGAGAKEEEKIHPEGKMVVGWDALLSRHGSDTTPPAKRCIDVDLAALIYTSGSTGHPKGVMVTHLNMVSAATSITTYLENTPDDIILDVLPLAFDYGLYQVLMGFKIGGTVVLERSFTYPRAVIDRIVKEKVTGFPIIPTISAILLQMDLTKYDFSSLRYITNTAAALPIPHILSLRKLFPTVKLYSMYGLTECKRVSYLPPDQIDIRPGSVGRGMPNEEVYVVDAEGRRVGPGVVGELVVRGSNVMKGYWEMPAETEKVLKPGPLPYERVLYTGDLFRTDEEGYLYFLGRKDDIIKTRGEKVSPREVENVLHQIEGVAEAAVVGVPDELLGSAIKAVIRLKDGVQCTEQDILHYCTDHLENFMVPKFVEFRSELPKTGTGKLNKRALV